MTAATMAPAKSGLRLIDPLRWIAALISLATIACLWLQHLQTQPWAVIATAVAPGVAFFLIWAIPFDMLMARVFSSGAEPATQVRYRAVIRFDAIIWLLLVIAWGGFFLRLLTQR